MELAVLQKDMVTAMKAKDKVRKEAISSLISAVKKVAIDEGHRDDIKPELVDQVILKELKTVKEQIDTCLHEDLCLFLIYIHQFLKRQITDRLKLSASHRHITRDKSTMILLCDCRPRQVNQLHVHLANLILEMIFGKLDPVRRKGRRKQNICSCLNICALQFDQVLRMLQNPFLRAYTNRHACLHQVTSGCTI